MIAKRSRTDRSTILAGNLNQFRSFLLVFLVLGLFLLVSGCSEDSSTSADSESSSSSMVSSSSSMASTLTITDFQAIARVNGYLFSGLVESETGVSSMDLAVLYEGQKTTSRAEYIRTPLFGEGLTAYYLEANSPVDSIPAFGVSIDITCKGDYSLQLTVADIAGNTVVKDTTVAYVSGVDCPDGPVLEENE